MIRVVIPTSGAFLSCWEKAGRAGLLGSRFEYLVATSSFCAVKVETRRTSRLRFYGSEGTRERSSREFGSESIESFDQFVDYSFDFNRILALGERLTGSKGERPDGILRPSPNLRTGVIF